MTRASVAGVRAVSKSAKPKKPAKPRKDYPLTPHNSGQWSKKVRGKTHYFGVWSDPVAAEKEWDRQKEALLDGRHPDDIVAGETVGWLCNAFMESKSLQKERGELSTRMFKDYHRVSKEVAKFFSKGRKLDSLRPGDFDRYRNSLPDTWGPVTINNQLRMVRTLFKFANDVEATPREIRYKLGLKSVSRSIIRKDEASKATKEFSAAEVWALLDNAATKQMRAFILLGLNAAYGTADLSRLRIDQIDFENEWLGEARGKTGVARGCWLWPETIDALRKAIKSKPRTKDPELAPLAFITRAGRPVAVDGSTSHPITIAFHRLKQRAKIDKHGVGHYSLRHTFATVASDAKDPPATDFVMGHTDNSMAGNYRHGIAQERVKVVCQHVRAWWLAGKPEVAK